MALMERRLLRVCPGRQDDMLAWESRWDEIEARLGGFPRKRRYWTVLGDLPQDTYVWEREWGCYTEMSDAYARLKEDTAAQALMRGKDGIFIGKPVLEYYMAW